MLILIMKFTLSPCLKIMGALGLFTEMLNILVAVSVWSHSWSVKSILIYCNNQAVVSVLNSGKTHDMILAALAHNICMQTPMADITIKLIYITGKKMWKQTVCLDITQTLTIDITYFK